MDQDASRRRAAVVAWTIWVTGLVLFVAAETLAVVNRSEGAMPWDDLSWFFLIAAFAFVTIGALVLSRYLAHLVGWLLCIVGLLFEVSFLTLEYGIYTNETNPGALPIGRELQTLTWLGGTAFFLMSTQLLLHFPDGRTPSPRWNYVALLGLAGSVAASTSEFLRVGAFEAPLDDWTNPLGLTGAEGVLDVLTLAGLASIAFCGVASAASLVMRFRRATGIQREQLKWVAASGVLFIATWALLLASEAFALTSEPVREGLIVVGIGSIPCAAGLAILRYRLYDIDWIINRTLVYVPLTAILAGVYIALTGAIRAIVASGTSTDFSVAMATVVVVAMLTPVKNYLQAHVDRAFKDSHDPAKELQSLAQETRAAYEVLDSRRLVQRLVERIRDALGATGAEVNLGRGFDDAVWQCGAVEGQTALEVPLRLAGETLGTLRIGEREKGRPYSAAECAAVQECADVIAYVCATSGISAHAPSRRLQDESRSFSG